MEITFIAIAAAIWLFGWIAMIKGTDTDGGWFKKWIVGPVVLFFLWPYVAYCMVASGDR